MVGQWYACTYARTHIYTHQHARVLMESRACSHASACACKYVSVCARTHLFLYTCVWAFLCACMFVNMCGDYLWQSVSARACACASVSAIVWRTRGVDFPIERGENVANTTHQNQYLRENDRMTQVRTHKTTRQNHFLKSIPIVQDEKSALHIIPGCTGLANQTRFLTIEIDRSKNTE